MSPRVVAAFSAHMPRDFTWTYSDGGDSYDGDDDGVTVHTSSGSSPSLSPGTIAGIVVGSVATLSAVVALLFFFYWRRRDAAPKAYIYNLKSNLPPGASLDDKLGSTTTTPSTTSPVVPVTATMQAHSSVSSPAAPITPPIRAHTVSPVSPVTPPSAFTPTSSVNSPSLGSHHPAQMAGVAGPPPPYQPSSYTPTVASSRLQAPSTPEQAHVFQYETNQFAIEANMEQTMDGSRQPSVGEPSIMYAVTKADRERARDDPNAESSRVERGDL